MTTDDDTPAARLNRYFHETGADQETDRDRRIAALRAREPSRRALVALVIVVVALLALAIGYHAWT